MLIDERMTHTEAVECLNKCIAKLDGAVDLESTDQKDLDLIGVRWALVQLRDDINKPNGLAVG